MDVLLHEALSLNYFRTPSIVTACCAKKKNIRLADEIYNFDWNLAEPPKSMQRSGT